jgi:DNA ligase (NAD+)
MNMTDHLRQIETKIVYYNDMYRKGTPVVSDQVFDALLEQFEREASPADYKRVRESLFSDKGDVKHQYVIGSLRKTKAEDDSVVKWYKKDQVHNALVVEKLDGMSIVLHYVDSALVKAVSRGDGEYGKDYTANVKMIAPANLDIPFTGQVRAEIVLPKSQLKKINDIGYDYKNPRNAVAGIIPSKSVDADLVKRCKVIAYQIMGSTENKTAQYKQLIDLGFTLPKHEEFHFTDFQKSMMSTQDFLKAIYERWTDASDYEIDGLVIHNLYHRDENQRLPVHTIAFKVNDLVASTTIVGIEWNMSRDKRMKPVVQIAPISLGGSTIRRATGNNVQWIIDRNLRIGSTVTIEKAGDIIPKIVDQVPNAAGQLVIPSECPYCATKLGRKGVDLICENASCDGAAVKQINMFLRNCGVEGVSEKTLENLGLTTFKKLMDFFPRANSHIENKLIDQLFKNVFTKTKIELICNLPFHGFGKKTVQKIMDTYGKQRMAHNHITVDGLSADRLNEFKSQFKDLVKWTEIITHDNRWKPQAPKKVNKSPLTDKLSGMSFCFTGKLNTMTRSEAEAYVNVNGGTTRSVSNKLTYLVTNNPKSGSSKNKKAADLGVQLITEAQFLELIGKKMPKPAAAKTDDGQQVFDINDL